MLALFGRMGDALVRHAFHTAANYLDESADQVVDLWLERVRTSIPSYAPLPPDSRDWVSRNTDLLIKLLRAESDSDRTVISASLREAGSELALQHIRRGIPLHVLLRAQSLYRLSVLNTVEKMLRRRPWIAFPQDILRAEDRLNEALDQQMLVTSESFLRERDDIIRQGQQKLENSNRQLTVLMQEMHHRIRNNLQTITDLLTLEIHSGGQAPTEAVLRESITRVQSIATVHEMLSAENVQVADIKGLCSQIAGNCVKAMSCRGRAPVDVVVEGDSVLLPSKQATALALVVTELVNNALEHGFCPEGGGTLHISLNEEGKWVELTVCDDGKGLPSGFELESGSGLGLKIVQALVTRELRGSLAFCSNEGTKATVRFAK